MKIKIACLAFSLLFSFGLMAQDDAPPLMMEVDYPSIEKNIKDESSPYFFPKLFQRYLANDTFLAIDDYHHLYYGYTFQDSYNSMARNEDERLDALLDKETLEKADLLEIIELEKKWLETSPFDLEAIYYVMYGYIQTEHEIEAALWDHRMGGLIEAILGSGDGDSLESAFHVAKVDDEYFLLQILGFEYGGEQSLIETCDYLKVAPNEYGVEGLYFNVERHFASMSKMFNKKD